MNELCACNSVPVMCIFTYTLFGQLPRRTYRNTLLESLTVNVSDLGHHKLRNNQRK